MTNALETLSTLDIDYQTETSDQPPRIWWHNGDKRSKTPGSFYTKLDEIGVEPAAPWQSDDRFDNEDGFATNKLNVAIIGHRSQAFKQDNADSPWIWLTKWEKGARIYTEVLCIVEGIDEPVVWACKGMTGKAVTGKGDGIIDRYKTALLREAEKLSKRTLPPWSFWLPIASEVDASGKLVYADTGFGSFITRPRIHWPAGHKVDAVINMLFVGKELIERGAEIRNQYADWFKARRVNDEAPVAAEQEAEEDAPPQRNVPQPLSEDDIPTSKFDLPF